MKKFKDLKVGDTVFIDFEKKTVTKIRPNKAFGNITIYINNDEFYWVPDHLSVDYDYANAKWVFTDKEAMVKYLSEELRSLEIDYENKKSRYKKWLERTNELE